MHELEYVPSAQERAVISGVLFAAFLAMAPCFGWYLFAVVFAPVSYFVAVALAHPGTLILTVVPGIAFSIMYWHVANWLARGIVLYHTRTARWFATMSIVSLLIIYVFAVGYLPIGRGNEWLNLSEILRAAFGPEPTGAC
jgi:hypothetical protein